MTLQRYFLQTTKQYVARYSFLQSNSKLTYCQNCHRYSTDTNARRYTDRHEWIVINKDIGTVGISNYAQESLGDVVFAQLPEPGTTFKAGDECGALESVKAASEIYSPLSGTVEEKNASVEDKPGLINSSCYEKGWLFKIKIAKPDEVNNLMNEEQYNSFLKSDVEKDHT